MKKDIYLFSKTKNDIAARTEQALLDKLPVDQAAMQRVLKIMEPKNLKRIGILAIGASALISIAGSLGRDRVYSAVVSREIKKQLDPLNKKLDALEIKAAAMPDQDLLRQLDELKDINRNLREEIEELRNENNDLRIILHYQEKQISELTGEPEYPEKENSEPAGMPADEADEA